MRLNDADALMDSLDSLCDMVCQYSKIQRSVMCGACPLGGAFDVVDNSPTVDVVEVVRCKYCKYYLKSSEKCGLVDTRLGFYETDKVWTEDSFCSWGESEGRHE